MIRLGSLAGYPFEGPRSLAGWTPTNVPAVYAIMCRNSPDNKPQEYSVIYVDHSGDLTEEGFPFRHPRANSWIARAGSRWNLHICFYEVPGGLPSHREQIKRELMAIYQPSCNSEKYDQTWKDEWIGEYSETMTDPLTTTRDPRQNN